MKEKYFKVSCFVGCEDWGIDYFSDEALCPPADKIDTVGRAKTF